MSDILSGTIQEACKIRTDSPDEAFKSKVEETGKRWEEEMVAPMIQGFGLGEATAIDCGESMPSSQIANLVPPPT